MKLAGFKIIVARGCIFFGDDLQQLNWPKEEKATINKIRDNTNFPVLELTENVRLSRPIESFVKKYLDCKDVAVTLASHSKELLWKQTDLKLVLAKALKVLKGTTAIICSRNDLVEKYVLFLQEKGYRSIGYKVGGDEQLNLDDDNAINVLTFNSAKGLEFENVVVAGGWRSPEYLYVGISRATKNVIILSGDFEGESTFWAWFLGDPTTYWQVKSSEFQVL